MTLSGLLDLGICYILFFLILSLIVTALNEFVGALLNSRPSFLGKTLQRLIDDHMLGARIMAHPVLLAASPRAAPSVPQTEDGFRSFKFPAYIKSTDFALATIQAGLDLLDTPVAKDQPIADLLQRIEALPPSNFRDVLRALANDGVTTVEEFRTRLAHWYDDTMDRASGLYKRNAQYIACAYGMALALLVNADLYSMGVRLWQDAALRQAIAEQSVAVLQAAPAAPVSTDLLKQTREKIEQQSRMLRPFPIGWGPGETPLDFFDVTRLGTNAIRLLGYVMTALAISLGAPFWFDLLQRFANIRATGPKPDTLREETARSNRAT
ncbi:hypothetical protein [Roseiterribacter gracilis]|uniref:Uncharacterized protein n=1 Tax=Roseiterribacter gracilis TaxID=2812848 RepID=A0A8S8X5Z6_9PROT|nr:hypothetical protein TMPK1_05350 [Rhodospirillales bacterium TMPK1]